MKVLVTGGTGVVGPASVNALLAEGHTVRLLSRHADAAAGDWDHRVEPWQGDVGRQGGMTGAAEGCQAVLHLVGIVAEEPPERTFESVNVEGTRRALREAERAGASRFVFVSSLGADRGTSAYHRSKLAAERLVPGFAGSWTIVRPGNVYGPGDQVISLLLRMVRTLPVVPVVHGGDRRFQPIWHEDLGAALARCVVRRDLDGRVLEVAGEDAITVGELLDRLSELTGRRPVRVPLPELVARAALAALGSHAPVRADQLTMLAEDSRIRDPAANALERVLGVRPTPLSEGLAGLLDAQPEQTPAAGVGPLRRRVFQVDIVQPHVAADALARRFQEDFNRFVPIEAAAEPGTSARLEQGATLILALPARGNVPVRVEELSPRRVLLVTLAGHPLAGAIAFEFSDVGGGVRFTVDEVSRPANVVDRIGMNLVGGTLQGSTWREVCARVLEASGGRSPDGVLEEDLELGETEGDSVERGLGDTIRARRRDQENAGEPPRRRERAGGGTRGRSGD